jgi:hypothetical protein
VPPQWSRLRPLLQVPLFPPCERIHSLAQAMEPGPRYLVDENRIPGDDAWHLRARSEMARARGSRSGRCPVVTRRCMAFLFALVHGAVSAFDTRVCELANEKDMISATEPYTSVALEWLPDEFARIAPRVGMRLQRRARRGDKLVFTEAREHDFIASGAGNRRACKHGIKTYPFRKL